MTTTVTTSRLYEAIEATSIRLIAFLDDTGYACQLLTFPLEDAPPYIALSYTWGRAVHQGGRPAELEYSIQLNERQFPTQQNLHDALAHLGKRVRGEGCLFWVDAICINQEDLAERASQVRQMTSIYEKASQIFAWLGVPHDDDKARLAVNMMQASHVYLQEGLKKNNNDLNAVLASISPTHPCFPDTPGTPAWSAWEGIESMLSLPYFSRVWVYQEATTPGQIWFHCGRHRFNDILFSAMFCFGPTFSYFLRFDARFAGATDGGAMYIWRARSSRGKSQSMTLLQFLTQVRNSDATDARDKVYAPLGLAREMVDGLLTVDYEKSTAQLYVDVAQYTILDSGTGLELFGCVFSPSKDASSESFRRTFHPRVPSWVPDWRQRVNLPTLTSCSFSVHNSPPLYDACPGTNVEIRFRGWDLELVGYVAKHLEIRFLTNIFEQPSAAWAVPRAWRATLLAHADAPLGIDRAIDRTIVGDRTIQFISTQDNSTSQLIPRGGEVDWGLVDSDRWRLDQSLVNHLDCMASRMEEISIGRRMALFANGNVGMVPAAAECSDRVAAFHRGACLYVVRSISERTETYSLVGQCYVDGMMDGQLVSFLQDNGRQPRYVALV